MAVAVLCSLRFCRKQAHCGRMITRGHSGQRFIASTTGRKKRPPHMELTRGAIRLRVNRLLVMRKVVYRQFKQPKLNGRRMVTALRCLSACLGLIEHGRVNWFLSQWALSDLPRKAA